MSTPLQVLAIVGPIVVSLLLGILTYVQAKKVAERNATARAEDLAAAAKLEAQKAANESRTEARRDRESLVQDLLAEIERLRRDRDEDQERHREETRRLVAEIRDGKNNCASHAEHIRALEAWGRVILDILSRDAVIAVLEAHNLQLPTMPLIDWRP